MNKRKLLIMVVAAFVSLGVIAQEDDINVEPAEKHRVATNGFWQNWFLGANMTWSAFYLEGERSLVAPFHKFPGGSYYTGLGASLSLGKWFSPVIGLRTKVNAWQIGKMEQGISGDKYWTANEQVLINATSLFRGYNEQRFWNIIPYIGAGVHRNMTQSHYSTVLSMGLLNTLRLSSHLSANIELAWNSGEARNLGLGLKKRNQHFAIEVGLTWNIGKSNWRHATDQEAVNALTEGELDALNAQLADAQAENERLQQMLEENNKPVVNPTITPPVRNVEKIVSVPVSIFFERGKSNVIANRDMLSVKALAELAIDKNASVLVTGYADTQTGSAEVNKKLSERRAQAVADELVRLGVSRFRIEVVAAGGVDTLSPAEYNRRATIELR